jgi:hypothetical protein
MALKIKWTPQADNGLAIVIEYLEAEWTFRNFAIGRKYQPSCQSD